MKGILLTGCLVLTGWVGRAQDPPYTTPPATPLNIIKAEYFVDTDPGYGNGQSITITPGPDLSSNFSINTTGLSNGPHRIFVRTQNLEGHWSIVAVKEFLYDFDPAYPIATPPQNITQAEYFLDADPGIGNGNSISITPSPDINSLLTNINTAGLSLGVHRIFLRTRNNEGRWSITNYGEFLVDQDPLYPSVTTAQNIIQAEYFVNTDPGFGNGVPISITPGIDLNTLPLIVNTAALSPGSSNRLFIRSLNAEGNWSITGYREFLVALDPAYPSTPSPAVNLTAGEYFFDTDPGFGNGQAILFTPAVDLNALVFSANTSGLSNGQHTLYVRSFAPWGITAYSSFNVGTILPLQFLSFSASSQPAYVDLDWKTTDEINTSHFLVERSADAQNWKSLATVKSENSSGIHAYTYRDGSPLVGKSYYRLKQVDLDSQFVYSKTLPIYRGRGQLLIYPNPALTDLYLKLPLPAKEAEIIITDAAGRVMSRQLIRDPSTLFHIPVHHLSKGSYFLKLVAEGNEWTEIIQKQ